jgi:hypothetical protein
LKDRQRSYTGPKMEKLEKTKIKKVVKRGYIKRVSADVILLLMHFFLVLKGDVDVRMVYDGSKSSPNAALWAPWFGALPTVSEMACTLLPGYWCADNNYGEMFLNFPLHEDLQKYCGVDLSQIFDEEKNAEGGPVVGV